MSIEDSHIPERIYGWMNTQLSVARFFGGIKYNGTQYFIAEDEEGRPLVRIDVLKAKAKQQKPIIENTQQGLFDEH